jgi:hypothetical protein
MKRVIEMDINQPPLCPVLQSFQATGSENLQSFPLDSYIDPLWSRKFNLEDEWAFTRAEFVSMKSSLVMYMLDRRMGKGMVQKTINKILISAMSGELQQGLSTSNWFKLCRKVSGKLDLRMFADQWVYGSGCPKFSIKFRFNRKKMMIEVIMKQENTNAGHPTATKKFTVCESQLKFF